MFQLLRRISQDDAVVKLLFDHVRNLGIAAVVLGAAAWQLQNAASGPLFYFQIFVAWLLAAFGVFLFFVNQFHGVRLLKNAGCPAWVYQLVLHTYSLIAVTIIASLVSRTV